MKTNDLKPYDEKRDWKVYLCFAIAFHLFIIGGVIYSLITK